MLGQGFRRPRDSDRGPVTQGTAIAPCLEPKGIFVGDAVAPIELESRDVEGAPMVLGASLSGRSGYRREPVSQLVQERQAHVERVGAGPHGDDANVAPCQPARMLTGPSSPRDTRRRDARIGADRRSELDRPEWRDHEYSFPRMSCLPRRSRLQYRVHEMRVTARRGS